MYFNTFAGSPVACAAATAVLDVIEEEGLVARAREVGAATTEGLRAMAMRHESIGDVRAKGAFWAVELVRDRVSKAPDAGRAKAVVEHMRRRGVLISRLGQYDNVLKIRPPLVFEAPHAQILLEALEHSMTRVENG